MFKALTLSFITIEMENIFENINCLKDLEFTHHQLTDYIRKTLQGSKRIISSFLMEIAA